MTANPKERDHFYINRKLVVTVLVLLIIGSGLVVLTNTAINLMSASRDYTALVAKWNQADENKFQRLTKYIEFGGQQNRQEFIQAQKYEHEIRQLINHLFNAKAEPQNMFKGYSRLHMKPIKVTNLITAFGHLQHLSFFDDLQASWTKLDATTGNVDHLATSAIQLSASQRMGDSKKTALLQNINTLEKRTSDLTAHLLNDVAHISEWINRFTLWITVILGLLLVLAGIVFSVKGWKSIKKWEEILKERNYLASFPELNPNPVLQVNRDGTLNYINPASKNYFPDINTQKFNHPFLKGTSNYFNGNNGTKVNENKSFQQVVKINERHFLQNIHYISNEDGLHIHAQDMTEKIKQEKQIRKSLKEKEVLLSEIHHRVKNNLAVISGLLEIQAMNDASPQKALRESQTRIQSMAMIHEILYEAASFTNVEFTQFIRRLIDQASRTYRIDTKSITISTEINDVYLNINQAIPAGLILNELLSNAIEHAFIKGKGGKITVRLNQTGKKVQLSVKDNGKGFSENFSPSDTNSTGFTIIKTLTNQLEANLALHKTPGADVSVTFQKSDEAGSGNARL